MGAHDGVRGKEGCTAEDGCERKNGENNWQRPDLHAGEIMSMLGEGGTLCAHYGDELCASASKACERKACEREYE